MGLFMCFREFARAAFCIYIDCLSSVSGSELPPKFFVTVSGANVGLFIEVRKGFGSTRGSSLSSEPPMTSSWIIFIAVSTYSGVIQTLNIELISCR